MHEHLQFYRLQMNSGLNKKVMQKKYMNSSFLLQTDVIKV